MNPLDKSHGCAGAGGRVCVGAAVAGSVSKPLNSKEKTFVAICYTFDAINTVKYPCLSYI